MSNWNRVVIVASNEMQNWSVSAIPKVKWNWPAEYILPMGTAFQRCLKEVPRKQYGNPDLRLITIKFDGSIHLRTADTRNFKGALFYARPGDVVYSRIDARNGAIGIVTDRIGTAAVSGEFPVYRIKEEVATAKFIFLLFRSHPFRKTINALISGTSGRKRVQPHLLESINVPLPPLAIQAQIVADWEIAERQYRAGLASLAQREADNDAQFLAALGLQSPKPAPPTRCLSVAWKEMERWSKSATEILAQINLKDCLFPIVSVEECVHEIRHGCSDSPPKWKTDLETLKISAVTKGFFKPDERKSAVDSARNRRDFDLKQGDVLMCRTNGTLRYVGMSALVAEDFDNLIFPDKVIRLRVKNNLLPEYLWKVLQTPVLRTQIESMARTSVGNYAIGSQEIWQFKIPLPPLEVQRALMETMAAQRAHIASEHAALDANFADAKMRLERALLGA